MIQVIKNIDEVLDFAWRLSKDDQKASYPRIDSQEQLRKELKARIDKKNSETIAFYDQNLLRGVCAYFWVDEEKYGQTTAFLIEGDYEGIADEFLQYLHTRLPRYHVLIGVPLTNLVANAYFLKRNIECIESSIVTRLYDVKPLPRVYGGFLEKINDATFAEYAVFHDKHAIPAGMYWDSKNLQDELERFRVYSLRQEGEICGSILASLSESLVEIFGLFLAKDYEGKGFESILIQGLLENLTNELGLIKEILYFIDDDSQTELAAALEAGFKIREEYRCYRYLL